MCGKDLNSSFTDNQALLLIIEFGSNCVVAMNYVNIINLNIVNIQGKKNRFFLCVCSQEITASLIQNLLTLRMFITSCL